MRRRSARVMIVLLLVTVAAAATHQAVTRSQALETAADKALAIASAETRANVALAEIAASQRAYVAVGQGLDFWAGKVDEGLAAARAALTALQSGATPEGSAALDSTISRLHDFAVMDRGARDYVRDGQRVMASDLIFADGYEILAAARGELAAAVSVERAAVTAPLARHRQLRLASLGMMAACLLVAAVLLLRGPNPQDPVAVTAAPEPFEAAAVARAMTAADDSIGPALDASLDLLDEFGTSVAASPVAPAAPLSPVDFSSAADVCSDLARLLDARDLQPVMARLASVLGAEGLIVWMADADARALAPALTHGYAPGLVARLGRLPIDADNATAAAWRAKTMQVVTGALAVPLLTSEGCTGVLAVELNDGKERASDVQSLARIVAAQLAATVSAPGAEARKAAEA